MFIIFNELISKFNFDKLYKVISILVTIISTYFVTKYTSNNHRRLEIKQKQLDKVYLPIYKLIRYDMGQNISKEIAIKYSIRIKTILINNYEYAYPQLHKLHDSFMYAIKDNDNYQLFFNKICYQINLDYDLLKKSLGYPSENVINLFFRMTLKDKLISIIAWVNVFYIFVWPITFALSSSSVKLTDVVIVILGFILLVHINFSIKNMKN